MGWSCCQDEPNPEKRLGLKNSDGERKFGKSKLRGYEGLNRVTEGLDKQLGGGCNGQRSLTWSSSAAQHNATTILTPS